ncbi:MAG: hypothetical protein SVQ76_00985 [Candidatus Nanohaloarchaea archaeon]|nr:hypothetical protein [Candidatus Nanohaloarchaea archaeon]
MFDELWEERRPDGIDRDDEGRSWRSKYRQNGVEDAGVEPRPGEKEAEPEIDLYPEYGGENQDTGHSRMLTASDLSYNREADDLR